MLEEFENEMERTDSRLKSLTSRVEKAIRKSGGRFLSNNDVYTNFSHMLCGLGSC